MNSNLLLALRKTLPIFLIIICSFFVAGILALIFPAVFSMGQAQLTGQLFRLRYTLFGREKISPYLVHVVFDDESLNQLGGTLQDRKIYGEIIRILKQAGAGFIACDIFFRHKGNDSGDDDFIDAVKQAGNVYFPVVLYEKSFSPGPQNEPSSSSLPVIERSLFYPVVKQKGNPYTTRHILTPFHELFQYAAGTGHINCSPGSDGINRKFPLVYEYGDGFLPALSLKMVCDYLDIDAAKIEVSFGESLILKNARLTGERIRDITLPVDSRGRVFINYVGPRDDSFYEISVKNLLAARDDIVLQNQLEDVLEGSLILISDTSVQNKDVGPGIFNGLIPYSDILITLANMVLTENFLKPMNNPHLFIVLFIFTCLLWFSSTSKRFGFFLSFSFFFYVLFICYSIFIFFALHIIPVLFFPTVGFFIFLISGSMYQYNRQKIETLRFQEMAVNEQKDKERLTRLDKVKTGYIDNLVHDLKNLLQVIKAPAHNVSDPLKYNDYINVKTKSEEIQKSISGLLEVAKIKTGIVSLRAVETDLIRLMENIYHLYKPRMKEKKITFIFTKDVSSLAMFCEPEKIKRIMGNLLENAFKHTRKGGNIEIILSSPLHYTEDVYKWMWERKKPEQVVKISVQDNGEGIKKEEREFIFRRFWQKGGTGIGLSIVKEYVTLHYGYIKVDSTEGKGSVFTFYLPCGKEHLKKHEMTKDERTRITGHKGEATDIRDKETDLMQAPLQKASQKIHMGTNPVFESSQGPENKKKSPQFPLLAVDDDETILAFYYELFSGNDYNHFILCKDSRRVIPLLYKKRISAVFLDLSLPHIPGMELLVKIKGEFPDIPVIIVTGTDKAETALSAIKNKAYDYLVKPFDTNRFFLTLKHALKETELKEQLFHINNEDKRGILLHREAFDGIITNNTKMIKVLKEVEDLAQGKKPVLITGEPGVGKELIAHAIHKAGGAVGEFVTVNIAGVDDTFLNDTLFGHVKNAFTGAAAKREGLIARAGNGTLFLDEIGELSMKSQVKLLRLIQEKEYYPLGSDTPVKTDVRIVAATNADLDEKQNKGTFRKDLADRLGMNIHIPPLRERIDDIKLLLDHFLQKAANEMKKEVPLYSPELVMLLSTYSFPGNVRELENMVEYGIRKSGPGALSIKVFKEKMQKALHAEKVGVVDSFGNRNIYEFRGDLEALVEDIERAYILLALKKAKGNKSRAAKSLGMDIHKLKRRLKKFTLE